MNTQETVLVATAVVVGLAALAFWAAMIVHCFRNTELTRGERLPWLLAVVFGKLLGAGAYYFLRYRRQARNPLGGGTSATPA